MILPFSETLQAGLFDPTLSGLCLEDYDYPLPESLIARYPLMERDQSRMLVLDRQTGEITHRWFQDLPNYLHAGDRVVTNNTQVLPVRFYGHREGLTGRVEILLLHPGDEPEIWTALIRPAKKMKFGTIITFPHTQATMEILEVGERGCCKVRILPAEHGEVDELMRQVGRMPIPPYLKRSAEAMDTERYQTVYAKIPGAQAAPTAGLHFTPQTFQALAQRQVDVSEITLAVSSGTFRTVEVDDIREHRMDGEAYLAPEEVMADIAQTRQNGGRILAVGTTVAKTLETVAVEKQNTGWSHLFIYPGFQFQTVDAMLTNFHLPKSTLLMLLSAFTGREQLGRAYQEALSQEYRFFSYGDCMLVI